MKRALLHVCIAAIFFISAERLPAPILEETSPSPTPRQPKSSITAAPARRPATLADAKEIHVVLSDGARGNLQFLRTYAEHWENTPTAGKSDVHPDEIVEKLRSILTSRFQHVTISSNNASSGKSGLVMIFDLQAHIGSSSGEKNTVAILATFKNENEKLIQTVSAAGSSPIPWPFLSTRFPDAVAAAFADFSKKLDAARQVAAR